MDKFLVYDETDTVGCGTGWADGGLLDDTGVIYAHVVGGMHDGHAVHINSEKHNCGAYGVDIGCSCGATWQSAMHGCWQAGHQRDREGDETLSEMTTLEYTVISNKGYAPIQAAHDLASKKIGFGEFKRIVRKNS